MSRELFKSMIYKNGKVFTRQCSNNVYPKYFYSEENKELTKIYNELGQIGFEKWFLTNGLMQGTVEILSGSNKILQKLKFLANLLWNDRSFKELKDNEDKVFTRSLYVKTDSDKEAVNKERKKVKEDIEKYISSFYDIHISKYKETERER